ncbi:putative ankyrin repeat protein L63 [Diplonema papillatum]|nr:putative ankyrin repeat protein L63 [Diplonema papillatum]
MVVQVNGTLPIVAASAHGQVEVIKRLIAAKARVNGQDNSSGSAALTAASALGHFDVVQVLIREGADVDQTDWPCNAGHLHVVQELIKG